MKPILVAPDKYKGTMSAAQVAGAIAAGLDRAGLAPVEQLPIADGGEGTLEAVLRARGGKVNVAPATDPVGRPIEARFAVLRGDQVAVVEVAEASGLQSLGPNGLAPETADTRGTGELIAAALARGVKHIVLAPGGSASTDGGRGALEVLGAQFGAEVDLSPLRERLAGVRLTVLCDVSSPLVGPGGAARTFAPQKGAGAATVARLERRLRDWAAMARAVTGRDPASVPGAGAGGGIAGGLWAFADAELVGGADFVLDVLGFDQRAAECRMVITGEGRLDEQTLAGKAAYVVARRCSRLGVPVHVIAGSIAPAAADLLRPVFSGLWTPPTTFVGPRDLSAVAEEVAAHFVSGVRTD